jgi:hypothetical protein
VVVSGNRAYDDQSIKTTYGVAMEVNGTNTSGFSNITINGNDVKGNKTQGIFNNTTGSNGVWIHGNPGYDPLSDASLTLIGQTGAIPFTFLYTTPSTNGAGMYKASVDLIVTHAGTGGTINACAQGSNGVGASVAVCTGAINTATLTEGSATRLLPDKRGRSAVRNYYRGDRRSDVRASYQDRVSGAVSIDRSVLNSLFHRSIEH